MENNNEKVTVLKEVNGLQLVLTEYEDDTADIKVGDIFAAVVKKLYNNGSYYVYDWCIEERCNPIFNYKEALDEAKITASEYFDRLFANTDTQVQPDPDLCTQFEETMSELMELPLLNIKTVEEYKGIVECTLAIKIPQIIEWYKPYLQKSDPSLVKQFENDLDALIEWFLSHGADEGLEPGYGRSSPSCEPFIEKYKPYLQQYNNNKNGK